MAGGGELLDQTRAALAEARKLLAESELRAEQEHELALSLQRVIMPPAVRLMAEAGVDVAARSRPGHSAGRRCGTGGIAGAGRRRGARSGLRLL